MGVLRFSIHPASRLTSWPEVHAAFLSTFEQGVSPTVVEISDATLICRKPTDESARLNIVWNVPGYGRLLLTTSTLIEREEPYLLSLELARGKVVQIRNQLAIWESEGLRPSVEFAERFASAHHHLSRASARQNEPDACSQEAEQALSAACGAAELLAIDRTQFEIENQHRKSQHLHTLLGTEINTELSRIDEVPFCQTFNALSIPMNWRSIEPEQGTYRWEPVDQQMEWCEAHKLIPKGGPLLNLGPRGLPNWLWNWEKDPRNLQCFLSDFVETAIDRYAGRIRLWEISARGNSGGALTLREEQRLEIVARTLDLAHHRDPEAQLFLRIDQPWGEYQRGGQHRLSPFQFADALLRAGLGLNGINLEIAVGYEPRGSSARDVLDWLRLIDQWAHCRIPLYVTVAFPSSATDDLQATGDFQVAAPLWKKDWTPETQGDWIDMFLPPLLAKPTISGIFWEHLSDAGPHVFPNAGLIGADGQVKPGFERLILQRQRFV